jgi:lysozyme
MNISSAGLKIIEEFEGFRSAAYRDSVGVWTIGYGTTLGAGVVSPLPTKCTQAQAQAWLSAYVNREVAPAINRTGAKLNQNQFDALCSLGYNLGAGCFGSSWAVGNDLRAGNLVAVSADFSHYVYAAGVFLQGLANRRALERKLFDTPYKPVSPVLSYHYDWYDKTPRTFGPVVTNEFDVVQKYDAARKHPKMNAKELSTYRARLALLAARLNGLQSTMDLDHRMWRLEQLQARADGKVVKPT